MPEKCITQDKVNSFPVLGNQAPPVQVDNLTDKFRITTTTAIPKGLQLVFCTFFEQLSNNLVHHLVVVLAYLVYLRGYPLQL